MEIQPNPRPSKFLADDRIIEIWRYGTMGDVIDEHQPPTFGSVATEKGTLDFYEGCVIAANEQNPGSSQARVEERETVHPEFGKGRSYWHYDGSGNLWHHMDVFDVEP